MLKCYEKYLGKYPFWNDGYALVETPYLVWNTRALLLMVTSINRLRWPRLLAHRAYF